MALTELQPFNLNDTANYTFGNATVTGNMNVGNAVIYTSANTLIIQNPEGGSFTVSGTGSAGTSQIANGDSNISILNNANINFSVAGYSNRVVFSETVANFAANLTVNGLITGGNANLGNSVTANFFVGNLNGNASFSNVANTANFIFGNGVSGEVASANVVTSSSQPNITSVGTLTDLSVAGNVTATTLGGALTSSSHPNVTQVGTLTSLTVTGNVVTANHLVSNNVTGNGTAITIAAAGSNQNVNLRPTGTGFVDVGNFTISNLATPVNASDAATKEYVDSTAQGLNVHPSCYVATTSTLAAASGGTTSYNNGTSGVGATITTTGSFVNIDGLNIQTIGTRILVKNEANAVWNGIYTYTSTTTLTRATDFDTTAEIAGGDFTFVTSGNTYSDSGWVQTTDNPTIGVNNIVWSQFSGAGTYTAGDGLTLTGTQFSVNTALPNVTSVGTLTSLIVSGNSNAANVNTTNLSVAGVSNLNAIANITITGGSNGQIIQTDGNGNLSFVTIDTWKIQNGVSNVSVPSVNGNVIVGVGSNTIATFSTSGLTVVGNVTSNGGVFTGDGGGLSNIVGGNITGSVANASYAATSGGADTANTVSVNAQPNITSVGTLSSVTVSGNANVGALLTNSILYANGSPYEFTTNAGGQNTYVQFNDGNIFGGSANFTFDKTTNTLSVTKIAGNGAALTSITGANVTGFVPNANYANSSGTAVTVTGNSQPNITSLGILSNLTISGNTTSGNFVTSGTVNMGTLSVSGNGTITGNLTVSGTTTFVNTATLDVEYPIIGVGRGPNNAPLTTNDGKDRGEQLWYYTTSEKQAFIGYDNSTGNLIAATDVSIFNEVVTVNNWGNFVAGGITSQGSLQVTGNATITGNLTVLGNTTYTNSNNLNVSNTIISMGRGANDTPLTNNDGLDRGSQMWYYTTSEKSSFMGYDNSSGKLIAATDVSIANNVVTVNGYGTLVAGNLEVGGIVASGDLSAANVLGGNTVSANYFTGTLTTAAQPNVTSLGTLTGVNVNGNIVAANITANTGKFTGNGAGLTNLAGANVTGQVSFAATANSVAVGNVSGIGNIATINKDGNSSNILYGNGVFASAPVTYGNSNVATFLASYGSNTISTTGNISAGNVNAGNLLTANYVAGTLTTVAQPNITSVGTLSSLGVTGNANVGNIGTAALVATGTGSFGGNVNMNNKNITNVAEPVNAQDVATKNYVDTTAQGLHVHDSCLAATTGTLATASGGTVSYNNGSSGVGATLTTTGSYTTIDGVTISTVGSRILVKNEANGAWNGVYVYTNSTTLTRATDYDTTAEMAGGDFLFVTSGTTLADTGWVQTNDNPVVGVSDIIFSQFSGAGTYQAGTGLTLTGQTFSVNASQTQITSVGTLGSLGVSGNITAANITANTGIFSGNGAGLTNLAGGNVTGTVANATYATSAGSASSATSATTAGTVTTAAQPNITSVGTLTSLSVTGNISGANLSGTHYGAATGLTSIPGGNVTGTVANATYATSAGSATSATTAGTVTTAAQPNITSVGTLSGLTVSATITGSVSGSAGTAGTVTTAAQPNITSTGTLTSVSVSGVATLPKINVNRSSGATTGITWYSSTYSSWTDYMASAGNTSCGPYGNITAPTGNLVTSWGLRSFIENSSGYGWTWEAGTAQQTTPSIVAELRSSDGSFRNAGNIYCVGDVITNYSDEKLKDVVGKIENAVEKVCAIDTFYYRPNEIAKALGVADEIQVGVGAGSVEKVASEVVKPSPLSADYKTVMYERLVPYLIESIKEHEKTIQELKQEINKLKGE